MKIVTTSPGLPYSVDQSSVGVRVLNRFLFEVRHFVAL